MLINLLGNAVKFTEQGEVVLEVELEKDSPTHSTICFTVKDTGIGIPESAQRRLFQAFTQADGSLTRKYGGTGLGLAICRQLVELMKGQLGLESQPAKGSKFWFRVEFEKSTEQPPETRAANADDLAALKVLVVDDNATNRQILQHQLKAWHIEAVCVGSGKEALEKLQNEGTFKLVILDMQMPEMDGLTLARMIRANPNYAGTRMIMLTSLGSRTVTNAWRASGIDGFLMKPVKQSRLLECICAVMASHQAPGASSLPVPPGDAWTAGAWGEGHEFDAASIKSLRILMAEDNAVNQKVALTQLFKLGYQADAVSNGNEAIEAVKKSHYDIILMDCHMPVKNGYAAALEIRETREIKVQPYIIAMTANAMEGDREKCLNSGMNDYVSKPVELYDLKKALVRAAEKIRPRLDDLSNPLTPQLDEVHPAACNAPPGEGRGQGASAVDLKSLAGLRALRAPNRPDPLAELVDLFIADTEAKLKELESALEQKDLHALAECAHSLKGSASNMGAPNLSRFSKMLETAARGGNVEGLPALLSQIRVEFAAVRDALEMEKRKQ